jgi:hypothetical protein
MVRVRQTQSVHRVRASFTELGLLPGWCVAVFTVRPIGLHIRIAKNFYVRQLGPTGIDCWRISSRTAAERRFGQEPSSARYPAMSSGHWSPLGAPITVISIGLKVVKAGPSGRAEPAVFGRSDPPTRTVRARESRSVFSSDA